MTVTERLRNLEVDVSQLEAGQPCPFSFTSGLCGGCSNWVFPICFSALELPLLDCHSVPPISRFFGGMGRMRFACKPQGTGLFRPFVVSASFRSKDIDHSDLQLCFLPHFVVARWTFSVPQEIQQNSTQKGPMHGQISDVFGRVSYALLCACFKLHNCLKGLGCLNLVFQVLFFQIKVNG